MILRKTMELLEPDSISGYQMKVVSHYSSFDKTEIEKVEAVVRSEIGSGITVEYNVNNILLSGEVGDEE